MVNLLILVLGLAGFVGAGLFGGAGMVLVWYVLFDEPELNGCAGHIFPSAELSFHVALVAPV